MNSCWFMLECVCGSRSEALYSLQRPQDSAPGETCASCALELGSRVTRGNAGAASERVLCLILWKKEKDLRRLSRMAPPPALEPHRAPSPFEVLAVEERPQPPCPLKNLLKNILKNILKNPFNPDLRLWHLLVAMRPLLHQRLGPC